MAKLQFQLGGQALIEGVMMRGPTHVGAAVRRADGSIQSRVEPFDSILKRRPFLNIPFARGIIALFEMLALGMGYLNWSSELALQDEGKRKEGEAAVTVREPLTGAPVLEEQTELAQPERDGENVAVKEPVTTTHPPSQQLSQQPNPPIASPLGAATAAPDKKALPVWVFLLTILGSLGVGVALFVALPNLVTDWIFEPLTRNRIALNGIEGLVKLAIFIGYVWVIGRRKNIKRVFEYHGAEHKVVYAVENNRPLTPAGARPFDTPHPRCGTGFALITVFVSVVCFAFLPWGDSHVARIGLRLLLLPIVAGISYEIIKSTVNPKLAGLAMIVVKPGMWLQRLTTEEPSDQQLEVACEAMRVLLVEEEKIEARKAVKAA